MRKNITVLVALFWGMQAFGYTIDPTLSKDVAEQITQDLAFMNAIKGDQASPLHSKIFGAVDGEIYKNFFESRVTAIGYRQCGSSGRAVACVIPALAPSKMWITDNYIKFDHPQIARLMIIYHEARHTEMRNFNWSHERCPVPFVDKDGQDMKSIWTGIPLAGQPACDITPYGSYGSSIIMLKNISKFCTNCTDKVKMDAGIFGNDQFGRIIDSNARAEIQKDVFSSAFLE